MGKRCGVKKDGREGSHLGMEGGRAGGGGGWHKAMVLIYLPLAAPIGLSPLHIPTLCGSQRGLVVSMEPLDSSQRRAVARAVDQVGGGGAMVCKSPKIPKTVCQSCRQKPERKQCNAWNKR